MYVSNRSAIVKVRQLYHFPALHCDRVASLPQFHLHSIALATQTVQIIKC
jgi:hypothetical protein